MRLLLALRHRPCGSFAFPSLASTPRSHALTVISPHLSVTQEGSFSPQKFDTSKKAVNIVISTNPHSANDLPFGIIARGLSSIPLMGDIFSESLATVEDAILASPFDLSSLSSPFKDPVHSYTFFTSFRSAKILRVSPGIEKEIGDIFRDEELPLDILPSLEEIELNATMPPCTPIRIDENQVASVLESFKPFVDARQRVGRVVKVHWNTDQVLPEYFCNTDM